MSRRSGQHPLATLAYYGPDNTLATKLVAGIIRREGEDPADVRTWLTTTDVRHDKTVESELVAFLEQHRVRRTITTDRIIGCPHQEGIDYPMGRTCPRCPYWANRDRFTHEVEHPAEPTMSVADVLDVLRSDDEDLRHDALISADSWRSELTEPLLAAIAYGLEHPVDASPEEASLFSYALYLLAKWREPSACPLVVRWLSLPGELSFEIGGDMVTQDGARMLAGVCDGDLEPIKALVLDREAGEYGRGEGVVALALLAAWAETPREVIVEYLGWLAREGLEREPGHVWDCVVAACLDIEALDVLPELYRAYDEGLVDPRFISRPEVDAAASAPRGSRLEDTRSRMPPITDVEHATAWWGRLAPYIAPPKVGRNAPCPCGSGKKFKKCCGR